MDKLIDGKKLAMEREEKLKEILEGFKGECAPKLVSFVNKEDEPSVKYTKMKAKKAEDIGIEFITRKISPRTRYSFIVREIKKYNMDPSIDGIMVQLPVPEGVLKGRPVSDILNKIDPEKDVDGLGEKSPYLPATVKGVMTILEEEKLLGKGKVIRVLGGVHGMVGSGLVKVLYGMHERVIGVSRSDPAIKTLARWADILISAVGQPKLVTSDMIKPGALVIDIGKDIDFEGVFPKVSRITPPIGGVGPMTVISLMENVVESYKRRN